MLNRFSDFNPPENKRSRFEENVRTPYASAGMSAMRSSDTGGAFGQMPNPVKQENSWASGGGSGLQQMRAQVPGRHSSRVLELNNLPAGVQEADLLDALSPYGAVAYVHIHVQANASSALCEFEQLNEAQKAMETSVKNNGIPILNTNASVSFANIQTIPRQGCEQPMPSNVLIMHVLNPKYPINTEVIYTISSNVAEIHRIAIHSRSDKVVEVLVELPTADAARQIKHRLNGCDIYSGCCSLKIEYANINRVQVCENNNDTWDYTTPQGGSGGQQYSSGNMRPSLLNAPGQQSQQSMPMGGGGQGGPQQQMGGSTQEGGGMMGQQQHPQGGGMGMMMGQQQQGLGGGGGMMMGQQKQGPPQGGGGMMAMGMGPQGHPQSQGMGPQGQQMMSQNQGYPPAFDYGVGMASMGQQGPGPQQGQMMGGGGPGSTVLGQPPMAGQFGGPPQQGPMQGNNEGAAPGTGMNQPFSVVTVYDMDASKMSCDRLFNLACLFGNVVKIKFLKGNSSAMVQMGDPTAAKRLSDNLNRCTLFGTTLNIKPSRTEFILGDSGNPNFKMEVDGSPTFVDYGGSRNNRFMSSAGSARNIVCPASPSVYYFNAPPELKEDQIRDILDSCGVPKCESVTTFPAKKEAARSSQGTIKFGSVEDAITAIALANHHAVNSSSSKFPYYLKLAFLAERGSRGDSSGFRGGERGSYRGRGGGFDRGRGGERGAFRGGRGGGRGDFDGGRGSSRDRGQGGGGFQRDREAAPVYNGPVPGSFKGRN